MSYDEEAVEIWETAKPKRERPAPRKPRTARPVEQTIQFNLNRRLNLELWKKLKLPPGWRKNPRTKALNDAWGSVRIRSHGTLITQEQIDQLQAQLMLISESFAP